MMIDEETFKSFDLVGKDVSSRGLISTHSGNMSMLSGGKIIITRRSAMLGWLQPEDLVIIDLHDEDAHSGLIASTEANVHRNIYKHTDAMAILHTHSPCTTALSMVEDELTCIDAEGMLLYKKIPIVECDVPVGSYEVAEKVPPPLQNYPAVVVRSHGVFAKGTTLEDALAVITGVEQSMDIRYRVLLMGKPLIRDYSKEKGFSNW
jgi:L-fuculose-phosphate aldolase